MAAAAIPGVFPPVRSPSTALSDGGAVNNTPISHALALRAERIYVLPTRHPGSLPRRPPRSALDTAMYGLGLLSDTRLQSDIARYLGRGSSCIVLPGGRIPPDVQPDQLRAFRRSDQ